MSAPSPTSGVGQSERTRPAIEAELVDKRYGAIQALREASFAALLGEAHALVGEYGAGKSTLIKVL